MWLIYILFGFILLLTYLPLLATGEISSVAGSLIGTAVGLLIALIYTVCISVEKFYNLQEKNKINPKSYGMAGAIGAVISPFIPIHLISLHLIFGFLATAGAFGIAMTLARQYKYERPKKDPEAMNKWRSQFHQDFLNALYSQEYKLGGRINILVSTQVAKGNNENIALSLFYEKSLAIEEISTKGFFPKKVTIKARSSDFVFEESIIKEWLDWSYDVTVKYGFCPSLTICKTDA